MTLERTRWRLAMALLVLLAALLAVDLLAWLFGADSRDYRQPDHPLAGLGEARR
jgi:hypothetical protein